jgi:hypothetical protein
VQCSAYHTFHMGYYLLEYALIDDYLAGGPPSGRRISRSLEKRIIVGTWSSQVPLPSRLIEQFSFGGRTIAPLLSASLTATLTFRMAWSLHGPSDPGRSSSARQLNRTQPWASPRPSPAAAV